MEATHIISEQRETHNYALIQRSDDPAIGNVVNVVVWDGDTNRWQPPEHIDLVIVDDGWGFGTGDIYEYETGDFYRVVPDDSGEIIEE